MKNSALIVAAIATSMLISCNTVTAQKGFQLGTEATPQFSWLINQDDITSVNYKTSHAFNGSFGISGQYGITDNIGIGLNVLYSFQGDKYEWKGVERYKSLQYLKIPLMLTVSVPVADRVMFVGKIGPQLGILTDARLFDQNRKRIIKSYSHAFTDVDFGGMMSAGIGWMLDDNICLDLAIRYDVAFTEAEDRRFARNNNIHDPGDVISATPAFSPRAITNNMTLGMSVGLRYLFK